MPPPIVPGIQDKNSKPDIEFLSANLETCLSKAEEPAIKVFSFSKDKREKDCPSLIIIPSNPPSLIKVLEPTPKTFILLNPLICFKKIDSSFNVFGLKTTLAGPPKLNQEYFERF